MGVGVFVMVGVSVFGGKFVEVRLGCAFLVCSIAVCIAASLEVELQAESRNISVTNIKFFISPPDVLPTAYLILYNRIRFAI